MASTLLCCFKSKDDGDDGEAVAAVPAPAPTPAPAHHHDPRQVIRSLLDRLEADPDDADGQAEMATQLDRHTSAVFELLREQAAARLSATGTAALAPAPPPPTAVSVAAPALPDSDPDWVNCIGEQRCTPARKAKPQTLAELVALVKDAGQRGLRVRAVGSGHAFSDIARTDGAVLVNPVLLNDIDAVDPAALRPHARPLAPLMVAVQAGVTVRALRAELDHRGLALQNMGGYDMQTLAGTLSTGTHGSGITFGPLASMARAIVLVAETGAVYQIERGGGAGITDPASWPGEIRGVPAVLKQDEAWFRAAQVAMGCLGVIYGYIIEAVPAFSVRETRTATTWAAIKDELAPERWAPVAPIVAAVDHFELVLNPYWRWFRHACVRVDRVRLPADTPASGQRQDWLSALLEKVAIQKAPDLVAFLTTIPFLSPLVIDQAMTTLVYDAPYTDKSYNVFSLGAANEIKGMALELHCDAARCVPTIDALLAVFQDQALRYMWYMAGPLGIRFVAASDAYLAPEAGRLTCTIELAMLVGLATGRDLARRVKERICTGDQASVRVHWGLDMDFVTADDVRAWYPDWDKWFAVYKELNVKGMFNNKLTDRLGISV